MIRRFLVLPIVFLLADPVLPLAAAAGDSPAQTIEEIEAQCRARIREAEERSRGQIKGALEILANNPPNSAAAAAAAESLKSLGAVATLPLLTALRNPNSNLSEGAALALWRMLDSPPPDVDPKGLQAELFKALQGEERIETRQRALDVLGRLNDASLVGRIEPFVTSPDEGLRVRALRYLGRTKSRSSLPVIVPALNDPMFEVRRAAINALIEIHDPATIPAILPHLDDQSYDVREVSYRAVGAVGDARQAPALVARLERLSQAGADLDKIDSIVFREASWCLDAIGALGSWQALPVLRRCITSGKDPFRLAVTRAMLRILPRVRAEREAAALDEVLAVTDVPDSAVQDAAFAAIAAIGEERALPKLYEKLETNDRSVVLFAIRTLGELGHAKAAPRLKRKIRDRNMDVVKAAAKALALLNDRSEMDKLTGDYERILERNPRDFRANRSLGDIYKEVRIWKRAVPYYRSALAAASDGPTRGEMQLRLAECYSLLNDPDSAFKAAQKAIAEGFVDLAALEKNTDLEAFRRSPRWKELTGR